MRAALRVLLPLALVVAIVYASSVAGLPGLMVTMVTLWFPTVWALRRLCRSL